MGHIEWDWEEHKTGDYDDDKWNIEMKNKRQKKSRYDANSQFKIEDLRAQNCSTCRIESKELNVWDLK